MSMQHYENYDVKQETVSHQMLTTIACDQRWPDVVAGISACFSKFAFVLFCCITNHLMTGPLGNSEFCFPLRFQPSHATAVNISWVTVNCFPFDVIVFAMLPAHGIWQETVSLLDVM